MIALLVILACGALNRLRGTDTLEFLPGRPLHVVSIVIAALGYWLHGWWGLAFGATYLLWGSFGWGHIYTFGKFVPQRPWGADEWFFWRVGGKTYWGANLARHAVVLPLAYVQPWVMIFPALTALIYFVNARYFLKWGVLVAEVLIGMLWGALLCL
ncbi:MAG: hypothetical protein M3R04_07045 [bacterium]|nr:hypothetical protein [bacterium]